MSFAKADERLSGLIRNASTVFIYLSILSRTTACPSLLLVRFMFYLVYDHFSPDHGPVSGSVCVWNVLF